jgi:hypothetical protein
VKVKCFGCDAVIEAEAAAGVADAFVAHGRQRHTWAYSEEAIRTYARNYGEATERLTGPTERLSEIGDVTVQPVTADRVHDWLRFFDHDAFGGNPDWASCYCLEPHMPATPRSPERAWSETRARMAERLASGTTFGCLAYVDGRPAGRRGSRGIPTTSPKRATPAVSAARRPCTTHAASNRSRCANVTR